MASTEAGEGIEGDFLGGKKEVWDLSEEGKLKQKTMG